MFFIHSTKIIDIDECDSSPCQNGAGCTDQVNGYTCYPCPDGYSGNYCEVGESNLNIIYCSHNEKFH